jgi:hypothetical protein
MATADSYQRQQGPTALISEKKQFSYYSTGPTPLIIEKKRESYQRVVGIGTVDSSSTAVPRIESMVQRADENIGDLGGKIFNSTGGSVSLVTVEYSQTSISGPWLSLAILSSDSAYSFPNGTPSGEAFNIPVEITDEYTGNIWMRIEINYA